jgi:superfamily II DNA or RNA helicase
MQQLSFFESLASEAASQPCGIVPRDYQSEAIDNAFRLWGQGEVGVIVRQPTGTGKTVAGSLIANRWNNQGHEYRTLVLAHEKQLIWQFADEVQDILHETPGVEMASLYVEANRIPKITIASRATLWVKKKQDEDGLDYDVSRLHKFDPFRYRWLLILDEVHRWQATMPSCKHILEWFGQSQHTRRLGLTATPERGDKRTLKKVVSGIAADYRLYDVDGGKCAVSDGWCVPYDQRFVTVEGVDFKAIREVAKDFDKAELEQELSTTTALASMVEPTLNLVGKRRTLIFCVTVAHAKQIASYINAIRQKRIEAGDYPADIFGEAQELDGQSPPDVRKDTYKRHQSGEFQFLVVCGLCREGYNDPGIQAVAVFRPTKSRGLAEQMKGRGCRPLRGCVNSTMSREDRLASIASSDKPNCMIVDLVGVTGMADCASTAHILASGKPDEVIERANKNATAKAVDDPSATIDMADEVRKAQREVEDEREAARLKRVERDRQERIEAERRASLGADVRYSAHAIQQGHGSRAYQPKVGGRMLWGKYKGHAISDVPHSYLRWFVSAMTKMPPWFRQQIMKELGVAAPQRLASMRAAQSVSRAVDGDEINRRLQEAYETAASGLDEAWG